jgi:hypothetical protein
MVAFGPLDITQPTVALGLKTGLSLVDGEALGLIQHLNVFHPGCAGFTGEATEDSGGVIGGKNSREIGCDAAHMVGLN